MTKTVVTEELARNVLRCKNLYKMSHAATAERFGISKSTVSEIVRKEKARGKSERTDSTAG